LIVEVGQARGDFRPQPECARHERADGFLLRGSLEIADPDMVARLIGKVLDISPDEIATPWRVPIPSSWIARKLPQKRRRELRR